MLNTGKLTTLLVGSRLCRRSQTRQPNAAFVPTISGGSPPLTSHARPSLSPSVRGDSLRTPQASARGTRRLSYAQFVKQFQALQAGQLPPDALCGRRILADR